MDSSEITIRTSDFLELCLKTEHQSEVVRCHYTLSPPSPGGQETGSAAPPIHSHLLLSCPILQPARPEDLQAWGVVLFPSWADLSRRQFRHKQVLERELGVMWGCVSVR